MLKRPSTRRKSRQTDRPLELNLVPMLDALVTLIAFLLFSMSFLALVSFDSPLPIVSSPADLDKKNQPKPLQLTMSINPNDVEIWSPFGKIASRRVRNLPDGQPNVLEVHEALMGVKQRFPKETKIILAPHGGASYDKIVALMDAALRVEPTDPPLFVKNTETGLDEPVEALFPEVIFGNILGDS